jgi:hypothetical protein
MDAKIDMENVTYDTGSDIVFFHSILTQKANIP